MGKHALACESGASVCTDRLGSQTRCFPELFEPRSEKGERCCCAHRRFTQTHTHSAELGDINSARLDLCLSASQRRASDLRLLQYSGA